MFVTHRPAGPLASCVDMIWFVSRAALPHSRERSLPTGRVDLVIPLLQDSVVRFDSVDASVARQLHGGVVSGAHDRFAVRGMGGPSSVIGVHFKAGGAAALLGGALPDLRNRTVLLDELWGPPARELRERLQAAPQVAQKMHIVEAALLARLKDAPPADMMVACALRALAADPTAARIEAVQHASGCSAQQFIRRFEAAVGLTPKRHARVLRFNALLPRLVRVGPIDWAEAAAEGGYYDQSHLIHEFKRLAGMTPSAYAPVHASQPTHVAIAEGPAASGVDGVATRKNLQYAGRRED